MTAHYLTVLGFLFLIYARQHTGTKSVVDHTVCLIFSVLALFAFVYSIVLA